MAFRLLFLSAWLAACGPGAAPGGPSVSCENQSSLDTYAANLQHASPNGQVVVTLVKSDPAPPARGNNAWTLRLSNASGGLLDAPAPTATPFMPLHGHGTSVVPDVTRNFDGTYEATPLYLFMPGQWQVTIAPAADAGVDDLVRFNFCIEG